MHASAPSQQPSEPQTPLAAFSHCHAGITSQMAALDELPALLAGARRAREVARGTLALFRDSVLEHHAQEERELFPAVLRSAAAGEEHERVQRIVEELTDEHRALEALWKRLEPSLQALAHGRSGEIDAGLAHHLVRGYLQHATFEEQDFLPLARSILMRNGDHMAALGLALHLRQAPQPAGYI